MLKVASVVPQKVASTLRMTTNNTPRSTASPPGELTFGAGPETPVCVCDGSGNNQLTLPGPANDIQVYYNGEQIS
jgi:hypothetical protein